MKLNTRSKKRGFTLVELLVVIAIIAVLGAIATPAIMGGLKQAKVKKVSAICKAVEVAVDGFETEYRYLPYGSPSYPTTEDELSNEDNDGLMGVLTGIEDDGINTKQIRYFELDEPKSGNSDATYRDGLLLDRTAGTAVLYDPWQSGKRFRIILDYLQGGEEDGIVHPYDPAKVIRRSIVIFSDGADKMTDETKLRGKENKDNPANF